jgi:hypothetical protein
MTLDDESVLTAYLDGALEPDERSALELALVLDPALAQRLRGLSAVRDLVAGLPRPVLPVDLTGAVSARIESEPTRWPRSRTAALALGSLGLAASLLLGLGVALRTYTHTVPPARRPPAAHPGGTVADGGARRVEPVTPRTTERQGSTPPAQPVVAAAKPDADRLARKREEAAAAEKVRALLESPRLRRVLIVTDIIGEGTPDGVEQIVQQTPRTDATYGRITVSQGIVVDPLHPGEATVFALVMNEEELKLFRKRLEQAFPESVEDAEADPVVCAQLGEIGHLEVLPGTPASSVVIPGTVSPRIALRSDRSLHEPAIDTQVAAGFGRPDLDVAAGVAPPPGPLASTRDAAPARDTTSDPGSGGPAPASKPPDVSSLINESLRRIHDPPEIVLVWVTPS